MVSCFFHISMAQWLWYRQDCTVEKKLQYRQHWRWYFNLEATVPSRRCCNFKAYGAVNGLISQHISSYFNVTTWETSKLRKLKLQNCAIWKKITHTYGKQPLKGHYYMSKSHIIHLLQFDSELVPYTDRPYSCQQNCTVGGRRNVTGVML